jgi:transposase, IS5 family
MSRLPVPQLSFADLQLQSQGIHLDSTLQRIADFPDENSALVEPVRKDLERGLKKPNAGRHGITPARPRALVLMRVKNLDYRDLRERINDGFALRAFTPFDSHAVPQHDAFNRAFNRITPATLAAVNQLVVREAVKLGLEDGQQLHVDTTVHASGLGSP